MKRAKPTGAVADTSVLVILARADLLDLLKALHRPVHVPPAVVREAMVANPPHVDAALLAEAMEEGWLVERRPRADEVARVARRHAGLGAGEREAIALARALRVPVLLDDALARAAARLEGVAVMGTLGVLVRARRAGVLDAPEAEAALAAVLRAGLWVSPDVVETARHALRDP